MWQQEKQDIEHVGCAQNFTTMFFALVLVGAIFLAVMATTGALDKMLGY